ncbi:5-formyltetrahydrofolate cyclo-ligase [Megasphaera sp. AM44-1BH]|uniref:5-formyltetrahydrofolate cyclo-ligase n=1 Tax=Megasphaera sp. AM44-1BH TaxID=2292358 RepID=UPI000E46CFC4|nr:5-formyltetrahydrofolate cyclo-ligase [Megasphaera sp. AM44-1BH]RHA14018.1 5-formyltetrahydrofolate cyclo-ligase [Megasphaera sp. AM44-1BH]
MIQDLMERKKELRKEIKTRVAQLSEDYCQKADATIRAYVLSLPEYQQARRIFCYAGTASEIQTLPLIEKMLSDGKEVGVPYCISLGNMEVRQIRSLSDLKPGRYGILAPGDDCPVMAPDTIDLGLIPCCTCNKKGQRLGFGGGFYDIYLHASQFTRVILCREQIMTEVIPVEAHDEQMDVVVSETGVIRLKTT